MSTQPAAIPAAAPAQNFPMLRIASLALVVLGLGISGYLSYVKFTNTPIVCGGGEIFNCSAVQNSVYSEVWGGIPIAFLGFCTYIVIGALFLTMNRGEFMRDNALLLIFGVTLFAWMYSMWLVYLQAFRLQAYCAWCLAHEANITVIMVLVTAQLVRFFRAPEAVE